MHTRSGNGFQGKSLRSYPARDALSVYIYIYIYLPVSQEEIQRRTLIEVPLTAFPARSPCVHIAGNIFSRESFLLLDIILWDDTRWRD